MSAYCFEKWLRDAEMNEKDLASPALLESLPDFLIHIYSTDISVSFEIRLGSRETH